MWVVAVLSTKPNQFTLCITHSHSTTLLLRGKKTKNNPQTQKVHPYRLHRQRRSMRQSFGCPTTPSSIHPERVVLSLLSPSCLASLIHSDTLSSLETLFPYSWHILTVSELYLTRQCQMTLNHQLLNMWEQYYIQNRTMYVLIKGICWCLGHRGMPQWPPPLCRDNLYGL